MVGYRVIPKNTYENKTCFNPKYRKDSRFYFYENKINCLKYGLQIYYKEWLINKMDLIILTCQFNENYIVETINGIYLNIFKKDEIKEYTDEFITNKFIEENILKIEDVYEVFWEFKDEYKKYAEEIYSLVLTTVK